ncbi:MAG: ribosome biogenesis GTPase Der [Mariprofundaceae bacterium]
MHELQSVVAIVGRPNVGKSTLFNRLVKRRKAIVGDRPGVTVDRLEATWSTSDRTMILVDTGGIGEPFRQDVQDGIETQVNAALAVADLVLFVVDGITGTATGDYAIASQLRRQGIPLILVVNKAERQDVAADFYALGIGEPLAVSAAHGLGIKELTQRVEALVPVQQEQQTDQPILARVALIGRPNVGKSTLVNAWLGEDRMVVSPVAGTTRDAVDSDLPCSKGVVRLIDTAGQRKKGRIQDNIEFVSLLKARQALARAEVAILLLDGVEGIVEQDIRLMDLISSDGRALVVAVNKADLLSKQQWSDYLERLSFRMRAMQSIPVLKVSAKYGEGIRKLLNEGIRSAGMNKFETGTGELNRWLQQAQQAQAAPGINGKPVRLKYCAQVSTLPPTFKIFCNHPRALKQNYIRYLEQDFRSKFRLAGVPVRFRFTSSANPYVES